MKDKIEENFNCFLHDQRLCVSRNRYYCLLLIYHLITVFVLNLFTFFKKIRHVRLLRNSNSEWTVLPFGFAQVLRKTEIYKCTRTAALIACLVFCVSGLVFCVSCIGIFSPRFGCHLTFFLFVLTQPNEINRAMKNLNLIMR